MTRTATSGDWLSRVHALLGVVPLGAFLVYHLWQQWPALQGREYWVDRARATGSLGWTVALVLVPIALHALLGVVRLFKSKPSAVPGPNASRAMRYLQAATGAVALLFLLYHLSQVYILDRGPHYSPRQAYDALWHELGRPLPLVIQLSGLAALTFHFAHGLPRALVTLGLLRGLPAFRRARYLAGAAGVALWLSYLQLTSHFAIGQGLLPEAATQDELPRED